MWNLLRSSKSSTESGDLGVHTKVSPFDKRLSSLSLRVWLERLMTPEELFNKVVLFPLLTLLLQRFSE